MKPEEIKLGDKLRDKVTGYEGIALAKTEWLNGCWRVMLQAKGVKDGKPHEPFSVDVQQLELVEGAAVKVEKTKLPGGPYPDPIPTP